MLKIALIGYGNMGKELEKAAPAFNVEITEIFDINNQINSNSDYKFDVAIDFSTPDAVLENIRQVSAMKKNMVIGTTGWKNKLELIDEIVKTNDTGLVYGSNFSAGMMMFLKLIDLASKLGNANKDYDIFLHELHHNRKKDSPSGTALSIAERILKHTDGKNEILSDKAEGEIKSEQLHVSSTRGGQIFGTHTVYLDSFADTIELTHRAKGRSGFANGALQAAVWINGKKGVFSFENVVSNIWGLD